jgi:NAD(P)-dependent dehydrogenase (short-subunit alcohol dehydrogenase family)
VICVARADSAWWRTADPIISVVLVRFGRLDIPVNNAAVFISKPFADYNLFTDYNTVSGVNLAGFFWLTQCASG